MLFRTKRKKHIFTCFFLPKGKPLLRNGLKQIFRCALALLKFVFKNETVMRVSLEPCQFSYFKVSQFHDCDNGNRS